MSRADDNLVHAAEVFRAKNDGYGDTYHQIGHTLSKLFVHGVHLSTPDDFNRFAVVLLKTLKMQRYCNAFAKGGHPDSALDDCVYGAMLMELDADRNSRINWGGSY